MVIGPTGPSRSWTDRSQDFVGPDRGLTFFVAQQDRSQDRYGPHIGPHIINDFILKKADKLMKIFIQKYKDRPVLVINNQ